MSGPAQAWMTEAAAGPRGGHLASLRADGIVTPPPWCHSSSSRCPVIIIVVPST